MSVSPSARRHVVASKHPVRAERKLSPPPLHQGRAMDEPSSPKAWTEVAAPAVRDAAARHGELLQNATPEAVHEFRRALRRVRALLLVFASDLPRRDADHLLKEVRWIMRRFGKVRDLDVLQAKLRANTSFTLQSIEEDALIGVVTDERHTEADKCLAAARSARATLLFTGLSPWLDTRGPTADESSTLVERVQRRLRREDAALLHSGRRLSTMGPARRHRLRSRVKMLKCALEAMPWLCPPGDPYVLALRELHAVLGDLNDERVGRRLVERMCAEHQVGEPHHQRAVAVEDGRGRLAAAWAAFEEAPADWLYGPMADADAHSPAARNEQVSRA